VGEVPQTESEHDAGSAARDLEWIRQRVLNVVGHELRTPTAAIRGLAESLAHGDDPAAAPALVEALVRNARRLEHLVDDLLAASGVTVSLPSEPAAPVLLGDSVRAAWAEAGGSVDAIQLDGEAVVGFARPTSMQRILFQVMDNAAKYGEGPVVVRLSTADTWVRVEVDAPGPVLPEEDIRYALEMFWRGERAVTSSWGLGIGLGVASLLAEHESGHLRVTAGPAGGMTTTLEIPAATEGRPAGHGG
jgi:two-component system sensor histidine kinase KdpD